MKNLDHALEVIGQALDDYGITDKDYPEVSRLLDMTREAYVLVPWPESQDLMEEEWFDEEAVLDVDARFGSSAYFVPLKRIL